MYQGRSAGDPEVLWLGLHDSVRVRRMPRRARRRNFGREPSRLLIHFVGRRVPTGWIGVTSWIRRPGASQRDRRSSADFEKCRLDLSKTAGWHLLCSLDLGGSSPRSERASLGPHKPPSSAKRLCFRCLGMLLPSGLRVTGSNASFGFLTAASLFIWSGCVEGLSYVETCAVLHP